MSNEVELIKSRLDIVEVIGEYVRLKQSGQNWKGLCPFHHEKSPSFMVHRERQMWHCFGCGEGGDVFSFVQKIENVDFPEALELLARKAGVTLTPRTRGGAGETSQRLRLLEAVGAAQAFYQQQLLQSPTAAKARGYLKSRAVSAESIATFGIGYSPAEWDKLLLHLRSKGFSPDEVVAAGLALKSERGPGAYDRFRDRLMFPINDSQGRVVGFGGRTLEAEAKEAPAMAGQAKYINSPQSLVYNKSLVVYNLDRAKQAMKEAGYAVLVEGYMDVIGAWEAGVKNVAASSGTALTPEQVKLLKRYVNEIRLSFDADTAGQNASERGIDVALAAELEVKVITLPFGKDPDECARQDPAAFRQAIDKALPIVEYTWTKVQPQYDTKSREGQKQAAQRLLRVIAKLPDPVERDYYLRWLSRELGVEERSLRERLAMVAPMNVPTAPVPAAPALPETVDRQRLLSERLLTLALHYPEHLTVVWQEARPDWLSVGGPRELYKRLLLYYNENQHLDFDELRKELAQERELVELLEALFWRGEQDVPDLEDGAVVAEERQLLNYLQQQALSQELKELSAAIAQAERGGDEASLRELLDRFTEVSQQLTRVSM